MSQRQQTQKDMADRRRLKLAVLMADPVTAPSVEEAAKLLGVNRKTIQRDLQAIRPDVKEAEGMLDRYKVLLNERLPIEKRVSLYEEIAKSTNPFAKLKALERIDELCGVITDSESMKARRAEQGPAYQPLFILPEGCEVSVTLNQQPVLRPSEEEQPPVRNITPGPIEPGTPEQN